MKKLFRPFEETSSRTKLFITLFWIILGVGLFEIFHSSVIPPPSKIFKSLVSILSTKGFYEDLIASLVTTFKAMFYSIIVTLILVYSSTIAMFKPLAIFVSKCRYLTLTGLVFVFTVLISNNNGTMGDLKLSLLMFGIIPFFVTSYLSIVNSIPKEEKWKGYVNRLNRWETLKEIVIVGKMDMLLEVVRQNFAISWMMITMVEGFAMSEGGIGTLLIKSNKYLDLSPVFAMLIIVFTFGIVVDYILNKSRREAFPYIKNI